jgi:hypothetical protein
MAGKYGSPKTFFLVDGVDFLAQKVQTLGWKIVNETEPSHGIGDSWPEHSPVGMRAVTLTQGGGFFNTTALHAILASMTTDPNGTPGVVVTGNAGQTIGQPFVGFEGTWRVAYEVLSELGKLTRANVEYVVKGRAEQGQILHALTAETADANTEALSVDNAQDALQRVVPITSSSVANPSVITTPVPHGLTSGQTILIAGHSGSSPTINGERTVTVVTATTFTIPVNVTVGGTGGTFTTGKTVAGAAAYLEMTAIALGGHTAAQVTIRDSVDDITFGDLVAFAPRTTVGAERVTVAGDVERYTAVSLDLTGAGSGPSVTYWAGIARF